MEQRRRATPAILVLALFLVGIASLGLPAGQSLAAKVQQASSSVRAGRRVPKKVNINTASIKELRELPGIGELLAQRIVAGRPYKSIDDLRRVKGLGGKRVAAIRNRVTI